MNLRTNKASGAGWKSTLVIIFAGVLLVVVVYAAFYLGSKNAQDGTISHENEEIKLAAEPGVSDEFIEVEQASGEVRNDNEQEASDDSQVATQAIPYEPDLSPFSQQNDSLVLGTDSRARYVNPFIHLAFTYPAEWSMWRNRDNGGWWNISLAAYNEAHPDMGGQFNMQIHPAEKDEHMPMAQYLNEVLGSSRTYEPYGEVMGTEAVFSQDTISFFKDGYRFNVEIRDLSNQTVRKVLDSFVFLPPPQELTTEQENVLQRKTWEFFKPPQYPFSFEYPPGWWIKEHGEREINGSLHVRLGDATSPHGEEILVNVIRSGGRTVPELVDDLVIEPMYVPHDSESYRDIAGVPAYIGRTMESEPVVHFGNGGYWYIFIVKDTELAVLDQVLDTITLDQ